MNAFEQLKIVNMLFWGEKKLNVIDGKIITYKMIKGSFKLSRNW